MVNKNLFKKIVLSLMLVAVICLCFVFSRSAVADAENLQDYDGSNWYMNYNTNITTASLNSMTAFENNITCVVQGQGGYTTTALFTAYIGNNMLPVPAPTSTFIIRVSVAHQSTTQSYLYIDFYNKNTTSFITSNVIYRVAYYTNNSNSSNTYVRLYNLGSPAGADYNTFGYYLGKYGVSIIPTLVGGSTYSTTILNNDSAAVNLFNKCFNNIYTDTDNYERGYNNGYNSAMDEIGGSLDTYYNNGYDAGYNAGASSINTNSFYNSGYNAGYNAGITSSSHDYGISDLLFSVLNVPIAVLTNLFSINIFGANVLAVIVSLLIVTVAVWVIKRLIFGRGGD